MTNEEVINRLEAVTPPDISLPAYRRELRVALLMEYSRVSLSPQSKKHNWTWTLKPTWRTVLVTSSAWVLVVTLVLVSALVWWNKPEPVQAQVIQAVMANPQVKAALAKDSTTSITVSSLGNDLMEVIVESRGPIIIAQVDTRNKAIVLKEISYVIILGSRYEPQEQLTSPEREKVLALASIDRDFRTLMAKGAVVVKTNAVECLIATRHFDTSQNSETREKWAMVQLDWQQDHWYFLVDSQNGRVINRNPAVVP